MLKNRMQQEIAERSGCVRPQAAGLWPGPRRERIEELRAHIFPICRSISGNGVRQTFREIGTHEALETYEVPMGTKVFRLDDPSRLEHSRPIYLALPWQIFRVPGIDRDRGEPRGPSPPTPPCVRVRTRRFENFR